MEKYHQARIDRIKNHLDDFSDLKKYDEPRKLAYEFLEFLEPSLDVLIEPEVEFVTTDRGSSVWLYFPLRNSVEYAIRFSTIIQLYKRTEDEDDAFIGIPMENYQKIVEFLEKHCLMIVS